MKVGDLVLMNGEMRGFRMQALQPSRQMMLVDWHLASAASPIPQITEAHAITW